MSTLSNGAPAEVEAFIYQDTDGVYGVATPVPVEDKPKAASEPAPRNSQEELTQQLAAAHAEGIREGERQAFNTTEQRLAAERARIGDFISQFQQERKEYYSRVEVKLVQFALAIAAKILHREAQVDRMVVAGLVKVMLEKLQQGTKVVVRVHPQLAESWRQYFRDNATMQVVEDSSLNLTDCKLETDLGIADVGLDAQLNEIEKGFFDLLAQKPVANDTK